MTIFRRRHLRRTHVAIYLVVFTVKGSLCFPHLTLAENYYDLDYDDPTCASDREEVKDPQEGLPDNYMTQPNHLQKQSPSCFAYSARLLLEFLHDTYDSSPKRALSINDIIGKGCDRRFQVGGHPFAVLYNLRKTAIKYTLEYDVHPEDFYKLNELLEGHDFCDPSILEQCCQQTTELLSRSVRTDLLRSVKDIVKDWQAGPRKDDPRTLPYALFSKSARRKKADVIPYNIFVSEPDSALFEEAKTKFEQAQHSKEHKKSLEDFQIDAVYDRVTHLLKKQPPGSVAYPLSFGFCTEGEGSPEKCKGERHATNIVNTRVWCCDDVCETQWNIIDSNLTPVPIWRSAKKYAKSFVRLGGSLTSIRPCSRDGDPRDPKCPKCPKCNEEIEGSNPLHYMAAVATEEEMKAHILRHPGQVNAKKMILGSTPIQTAAESGNIGAVRALLDAKADAINEGTLAAISEGHVDIVKAFFERKSDLKSYPGYSAFLPNAAGKGKLSVLKLLVEEQKMDVDSVDEANRTVLFHAADKGHAGIIKYLLEKGAEVDKPSLEGEYTPLQQAVIRGHFETAKILLKAGADPTRVAKDGRTMVAIAKQGPEKTQDALVRLITDAQKKSVKSNAAEQKNRDRIENTNSEPRLADESKQEERRSSVRIPAE